MKKPKKLKFVIVGTRKSKTWVRVAANSQQTDILFRATTGLAPAGEYLSPQLPKVRFQIDFVPHQAQINVFHGSDFVAEAAIACPDGKLFLGMLGYDDVCSDMEDLQFRSKVRKAQLALQPPACLMVWKKLAAHRLTVADHQLVIEETQYLAGAVVAVLMVNFNEETSD